MGRVKTLPYAAMQEKYPLVLMSGGLDSTYLTYSLLKISPVDVLYVRSNQGEQKIRMEQQAVGRIISAMETDSTILHRIRSQSVETVMDVHSARFIFQQILPWMIGALKTVHPDRHSKVCFGYVLGDQAIGWKTEILTAWNNLCEVLLGSHIPLEFPLIRNIKEELIRGLPYSVRQKIWVCELPEYRPVDNTLEVISALDQMAKIPQLGESDKPDPPRPYEDPGNYFPCGNCPACKRHRFIMANVGFDYKTISDTDVEELRKIRAALIDEAVPCDNILPESVVEDAGVHSKSADGAKVSPQ